MEKQKQIQVFSEVKTISVEILKYTNEEMVSIASLMNAERLFTSLFQHSTLIEK